jgi:hypothetical protein
MQSACGLIEEQNVVFIDADTCILMKNWDLIIYNALKTFDIYGTAFSDKAKQYNKFPNVFLFCFRRDILKHTRLNFDPLLNDGIESPVQFQIKTKMDSESFNKNIGDTIKCDTGYRLPVIANINRFRYDYIPMAEKRLLPYRNDTQKAKCAEKPSHMAEWHINDKIFITHKQASRNHPIDGEWGAIWKDRIGLYTEKEFGFVY